MTKVIDKNFRSPIWLWQLGRKNNSNRAYPTDKDGLAKADHLECDRQTDWYQIVIQDDEREYLEDKWFTLGVFKL